jgi:hypothetical protein
MSPVEGDVWVDALGGGAGDPLVGISPATTETESTHASATVIKNRLMDVSPLNLRMQEFLHRGRIEQLPEILATLLKEN